MDILQRHTDPHGRHRASDPLAARRARYERIRGARDSGMTLEVIGALFDPPMSKQRVARILAVGSPRNPGRPVVPRPAGSPAKRVRRRRAKRVAGVTS